ncbi:MAG: glutamine--fructose-6-phosphate transaminase (isomerizing) [Candidatus Diapherotrites archaeon]|nr:glutamine--fructose-6-phosphate transaminase (isomerizing) [Candidatus Diapherotrites archaeon]
MCGIVGYCGNGNVSEFLPACLKRLDYRGYDSFGFSVLSNGDHKILKRVGKLDYFAEKIQSGNIGIAHTRWATHGKVSEKNAHPHLSCDKRIAVVHNGIIENHSSLRRALERKGHFFSSETDTEVVPHLIEAFLCEGKGFREAVTLACNHLEGNFALLILDKKSNQLCGAKNGSPLVVGLGNEGIFFASDPIGFIDYAGKAIFLGDGEIAFVKMEGNSEIEIFGFNGEKKAAKKAVKINLRRWQAEKNGFKHFMLKEIFEQPECIESCTAGRIKNSLPVLEELEGFNGKIKKTERIVIVACGTSLHAGMIAEFLIEKLWKVPVKVECASEFRYRCPVIGKNCLVVAISQSGETADTLAALREAKRRGAQTMAIVNVEGSTIARESGAAICTKAGPEIGVASTKAFTTQIAVLLLFALYGAVQRKTASKEEIKLIVLELKKVPVKMREIFEKKNKIKFIAKVNSKYSNFLFLGRGIDYFVALEGALKLKEISYVNAWGMPAAEMKHGTIALIDKNFPAVFVGASGALLEKLRGNIQEVKARSGKVISIINECDSETAKLCNEFFCIPKTHELVSPLLSIIPLQLFAYYVADEMGREIDKPRNLAKSVTVE